MAGTELGPWMFPGSDGQPVRPTRFWQLWIRILKVAGVQQRKPHAARHTFASRLIEQGKSLAYVRDQLGLHSIKITVGAPDPGRQPGRGRRARRPGGGGRGQDGLKPRDGRQRLKGGRCFRGPPF